MKIVVTEKDIRTGRKFAICECPVALAIKRAFNTTSVRTYTSCCYVGQPEVEYLLPVWVHDKIRKFDMGNGMEPFEFELIK